jgi:nucleotide-binding universal stress UspA family protein
MFKKILVPLDGSELAECVLPHVESIARGCGVESVIFLRVVEPFHIVTEYRLPGFSAEDIKRMDAENKASAEKYLSQLVNRTKYNGIKILSETMVGKVAESIAEYAADNDVDLITIATHGRSGVSRWVWGSVADRILRSVCVPILMVRAPGCIPGI